MPLPDGNSWVHKASYGCAREVVNRKPTDFYVVFVLRRILMLKRAGITPIVVFDGAKPVLKQEVEKSRDQRGEVHAARGRELDAQAGALKEGSPEHMRLRLAADEAYQRAVRVRPGMVAAVMSVLQQADVECMVAPYEADAQLAWLALEGRAQAIITEDSDLSVFLVAARASCALWFKLTSEGHAWELPVDQEGTQAWARLARANAAHHEDLRAAAAGQPAPAPLLAAGAEGAAPPRRRRTLGAHWLPKAPKGSGANFLHLLQRFTPGMYVHLAVLAGCDYAASLPGVGLITAAKALLKVRAAKQLRRLRLAVQELGKRAAKQGGIPDDYLPRAAKAAACFLHQIVWNTRTEAVQPLRPVPAPQFEVPSLHHRASAQASSLSHAAPWSAASVTCPALPGPARASGDDVEDDIEDSQEQAPPLPATPVSTSPTRQSQQRAPASQWLEHPSWAFLGTAHAEPLAKRVARGEVNPRTLLTVSPAKVAPVPGAARSSPEREAAAPQSAPLFAITTLDSTQPKHTLAVANLVAALRTSTERDSPHRVGSMLTPAWSMPKRVRTQQETEVPKAIDASLPSALLEEFEEHPPFRPACTSAREAFGCAAAPTPPRAARSREVTSPAQTNKPKAAPGSGSAAGCARVIVPGDSSDSEHASPRRPTTQRGRKRARSTDPQALTPHGTRSIRSFFSSAKK